LKDPKARARGAQHNCQRPDSQTAEGAQLESKIEACFPATDRNGIDLPRQAQMHCPGKDDGEKCREAQELKSVRGGHGTDLTFNEAQEI
jgi:hypothetical protein